MSTRPDRSLGGRLRPILLLGIAFVASLVVASLGNPVAHPLPTSASTPDDLSGDYQQFWASAWGAPTALNLVQLADYTPNGTSLARYVDDASGATVGEGSYSERGAAVSETGQQQASRAVAGGGAGGIPSTAIVQLAYTRTATVGRVHGADNVDYAVAGEVWSVTLAYRDAAGSIGRDSSGQPLSATMHYLAVMLVSDDLDDLPALAAALAAQTSRRAIHAGDRADGAESALIDIPGISFCDLFAGFFERIACGPGSPSDCAQCSRDCACDIASDLGDFFDGLLEDILCECIGVCDPEPGEEIVWPDLETLKNILKGCGKEVLKKKLAYLIDSIIQTWVCLRRCNPPPTLTPVVVRYCATPPPSVVVGPTSIPGPGVADGPARLRDVIGRGWPGEDPSTIRLLAGRADDRVVATGPGGGAPMAASAGMTSDPAASAGLPLAVSALRASDGTAVGGTADATYIEEHAVDVVSIADSPAFWVRPYKDRLRTAGLDDLVLRASAGWLTSPSGEVAAVYGFSHRFVSATAPGGELVTFLPAGAAPDMAAARQEVDAAAAALEAAVLSAHQPPRDGAAPDAVGRFGRFLPQRAVASSLLQSNPPYDECVLNCRGELLAANLDCLLDLGFTIWDCKLLLSAPGAGWGAFILCVAVKFFGPGGSGIECVLDFWEVHLEAYRNCMANCQPLEATPFVTVVAACSPTPAATKTPKPTATPSAEPTARYVVDFCEGLDEDTIWTCSLDIGVHSVCLNFCRVDNLLEYCDSLACNCQRGVEVACAGIRSICTDNPNHFLCRDLALTCSRDPSLPICRKLPWPIPPPTPTP